MMIPILILLRDLAVDVRIAERAVHRIIVGLEADGCLNHIRDGRRNVCNVCNVCNVYKVFTGKPLRHDIEKHTQVHDLIQLINK